VTAGISTFGNPNGSGSGTQFAAQATGNISGFSSAMLRAASPLPPTGLSFANTVAPAGQFGGSHCMTDYFATVPGSFTAQNSVNLTALGGSTVSAFRPPDPYFTLSGGNVTAGERHTIYVDGDVVINGNIDFPGAGGRGNIDQIASFYLIVRGNIFINDNVSLLNGIFIAQPGSAPGSGSIYTCSSNNAVYSDALMFDRCGSQLRINGALVAQNIEWLRTFGSLRNSTPTENPNTGPVFAGEIINFSPDTYLITPTTPTTSSGTGSRYEYITSLPPVL